MIIRRVLFIAYALTMASCSYVTYTRNADGSVSAAGFEIGVDKALSGFRYQNGDIEMAIDSLDQNQTNGLAAITEAVVKGAIKGATP